VWEKWWNLSTTHLKKPNDEGRKSIEKFNIKIPVWHGTENKPEKILSICEVGYENLTLTENGKGISEAPQAAKDFLCYAPFVPQKNNGNELTNLANCDKTITPCYDALYIILRNKDDL